MAKYLVRKGVTVAQCGKVTKKIRALALAGTITVYDINKMLVLNRASRQKKRGEWSDIKHWGE